MKGRSHLRVIVIVFFLILISSNAQSLYAINWSPDTRVTWDTKSDWHPSITQANDGKIWLVWHSYRINDDAELFYKVYDSSQVHPWSPDTRLTFADGADLQPSIMKAADGRIWVIWAANRTAYYEIYYKIYNGTSWSSDTKLPALREPTNASGTTQFPSILQAANGTIWVFWTSKRTGNREIFYKTSSDNGASWSDDTPLTAISSSVDDRDPSVTQANDGKIWLVWTKDFDIFYTFYNGASWSPGAAVTIDSNFDSHPAIAQAADGKIYVFWDSDRSADQYDIFYNSYDGANWSSDTALTSDAATDMMPSAMRASDGNLWVTWASDRNGNLDIYYKTTSIPPPHDVAIFSVTTSKNVVNRGETVPIEVVAQNKGTSSETFDIEAYADTTLVGRKSSVSLIPGELYPTTINWNTSSTAAGTYIISAKASIVTGETNTADNTYTDGTVTVNIRDVAITNITLSSTLAYKGYTRDIYVEVKNEGTVSETFNVVAYYNSTQISGKSLTLGPNEYTTLTFSWSTTFVTYGSYIISAKASKVPSEQNATNNSFTDGSVLVTIPGDVNGDKTVDSLDVATLSVHWYPGPPVGPLGYNATADINNDGNVNILDIGITSAHWSQSW